ncbi:hypothetical protein D3C74_291860 [compost metagenome]
MAHEELDRAQRVEVDPARLHEADRAVDLRGRALVARVCGVAHEAAVPLVHLSQVGETATRERPDHVEGRRRDPVGLHEPLGVRDAVLGREGVPVDHVAAVRGQRDPLARLVVRAARLGVLPREPTHLHDGHARTVRQDHGHLQDGADLVADAQGVGVRERLGAVTALQEEGLTPARGGEPRAQGVGLRGDHERRGGREPRGHVREGRGVGPRGLLLRDEGTERVQSLGDLRAGRGRHQRISAPWEQRARAAGRSRPAGRRTTAGRRRTPCRPRCAGTRSRAGGRRSPRRGRSRPTRP